MPKLPLIVVAQFFCTSLWFAGNAVLPQLTGHITSAIQFGFITGTLFYAATQMADRNSPSTVFFLSALIAATCNLGLLIPGIGTNGVLLFRFLTGFFLAGIYPVGMKIAADYFEKGLGLALGFLVGALVLGTALPHLLKAFTNGVQWQSVIYATSGLSLAGGLLIRLFVPDGPFRKPGQRIEFKKIFLPFRDRHFQSASFGYFGHMWELYTFWAFAAMILAARLNDNGSLKVELYAFIVIGIGCIACIVAGLFSKKYGSWITAFVALFLSGCCCLFSPLLFGAPLPIFIAFLIFWGFVVIADSPMFSTLVAQNASSREKATALTIVTCIGFSITIISIELVTWLFKTQAVNPKYLGLILFPGPVFGMLFMLRSKNKFLSNKIYQRLKYSRFGDLFRRLDTTAINNELKFYRSFLPDCDLIFDIGANDGHKTIAFASLSKRVIACDPDPFNLEILNARFKRAENISIEAVAVSDHIGRSELLIHEPGSALNSLNPYWKNILERDDLSRWKEKIQFTGSTVEVDTITLDALIVKYGIPDFIKIDVEGHEKQVLKGLTRSIPCISFEVLLPEFLDDALYCVDHLKQFNPSYRLNYAADGSLILKEFLPAAEFISILKTLNIPHLEIIVIQ